MSERRVVITGIGVVSPVGNNLETFWESLKAGRSGIGSIAAFDTGKFDCKIAGEVRGFDATPYYKVPKDVRRTDRYTQLAMGAAKMSLDDSGLDLSSVDLDRAGVMIGSGVGGLATMETQVAQMIVKGPDRTSPFMIPMMISNMASGFISMEHGLRGPNMAIVTACATANHCMGEAWRIIKFGDADIIFAGGSEACVVPVGIAGFAAMRALSVRNDEPERASRPFDKDRDGFVMGEGAGVLILEEYEHAKKRGAKIYCEVAGYGLTADAYHMSAPSPGGEGAARCMGMAMNHARVNPAEVDYINAHGTSTPVGDVCETKAMKRAFGDHAKNGLAVSSTKSMTGHLLGAAGAVEMAACVMAMRDGILPPTINLENPDPECDLDYVPNKAREKKVKVALSNSFGFGGHNSSLLIRAVWGTAMSTPSAQQIEFVALPAELAAFRPRVAMVLGSGLGSFADAAEKLFEIPYSAVPGLPESKVPGHAGKFVGATMAGTPLLLAMGRVHYYEGHTPQQIAAHVRLMASLGPDTLILTNAAGTLNPRFAPGEWMMLSDQLNLTAASPLSGGPNFHDMTEVYDAGLRSQFREVAVARGMALHEGVYACVPGPQYETPAEVRMLRTLGADAVGMSTVFEAIQARALGRRVAAFSCLTNWAAGVSSEPLSHDEVMDTGRKAASSLVGLLQDALRRGLD